MLIFGSAETFSITDQRLDEILPNTAHFLTIKTHSVRTEALTSHIAVKMWNNKHHGLINTNWYLLILHDVVFLRNHCTIITCNSAKYSGVCVPNETGLHIKCLKFSAEAVKSLMETRKHTPRHKGTCCRHIFAILPAVNQKDQGDKIFWTDYVLRSAFHEAVCGRAENKVLRLFEQCSTLQVVKHFRNFSNSGNILLKMWYNVQFAQVTETTFWLITSLMNQRRISFDMMSLKHANVQTIFF